MAYRVARNPLSTSLMDWIRGCLTCTGSDSFSKRSTRQYMGGWLSNPTHSWRRKLGVRSNRRRRNPIFSNEFAKILGCPIIIADVKSARASKNLAMKNISVMTAKK